MAPVSGSIYFKILFFQFVRETHLNIFSEGPEDLFGHPECSQEAVPAKEVNGVLARVVPVEVRDGLLES